jgi:uncharacterized protein
MGSFLHDVGKAFDQSIRHGYLGYVLLGEEGYDYELCNVCANHTLIDRTMAEKLDIPKRHYTPFTIEEAVVTYADKIVNNVNKVGLDERWYYLEKKYNGTGWFNDWKVFARPESYELEEQVNGFLKKKNKKIPPLIDALELLGKSFSRIKNPEKRIGITKHSLGVSGLSSLIAKNIKGLGNQGVEDVRYGGLLHDVGRGSAWAVEHPLVGRMMLQSRNYPESVIGVNVGHCIFPKELAKKLNFPKPWGHYHPSNIHDDIVTYADKMIYLDQLLPNIEKRYKIWKKLYGKGDNFKIWFPEMKKGLNKIKTLFSLISKNSEISTKTINDEIDLIFDQYGVSKQEAYQTLNIEEPIVVDFEPIEYLTQKP